MTLCISQCFRWFSGELTSADAMKHLLQIEGKEANNGAFLIRREGGLTLLSVRDGDTVRHYPINRKKEKGTYM